MRAARALEMLLLLERRGKMTAKELSRTLEVSERTVLRDVEVLGEAGVPVFTTRGTGGGIQLVAGFRTRLSGLTPEEAGALLLVGLPHVARRLGLESPTRIMRHKLLGIMQRDAVAQAEHLGTWFLHDPDPVTGHRIPDGELRRLRGCIQRHRQVEIMLEHEPTRTVQPLGLVLKAGSWHLIVVENERTAAVCIDDLRATRITRESFIPPADFDLADFWHHHSGATQMRPAPCGIIWGR